MSPWILAARPKTLLAGVAPVAVGAALAIRDGVFHPFDAWMCLAGAVAIQIGTNFCNDYFDFVQGADTASRVGPTRAVAAGIISPDQHVASHGVMTFAVAPRHRRLPGVACRLDTAGGRRSSASPAASGTRPVDTRWPTWDWPSGSSWCSSVRLPSRERITCSSGHLTMPVLVAGLGPGWLAVALLVVNNLRDIEEDRAAGKRTLAVRFGATFRPLGILQLSGGRGDRAVAVVVVDGIFPSPSWPPSFRWPPCYHGVSCFPRCKVPC